MQNNQLFFVQERETHTGSFVSLILKSDFQEAIVFYYNLASFQHQEQTSLIAHLNLSTVISIHHYLSLDLRN